MRSLDETWLTPPMRFLGSGSSLAPIAPPETEWRNRHFADWETPLDPGHILVSLLLPIGDTLLATPALAALRRRFPLARITALASRSGPMSSITQNDRPCVATARSSP